MILWAFGRSATDTFAQTLQVTSRWDFCLGQKEGFKKANVTAAALSRCTRKGQRLTHLKPWHVLRRRNGLSTPDQFFSAAAASGWGVVVGSFRENQLARDVSAFELNHESSSSLRGAKLERIGLALVNGRNRHGMKIIDSFEKDRHLFNAGIAAVRATRPRDVGFHSCAGANVAVVF